MLHHHDLKLHHGGLLKSDFRHNNNKKEISENFYSLCRGIFILIPRQYSKCLQWIFQPPYLPWYRAHLAEVRNTVSWVLISPSPPCLFFPYGNISSTIAPIPFHKTFILLGLLSIDATTLQIIQMARLKYAPLKLWWGPMSHYWPQLINE